jgi:hypothetical protein
MLEMLTQGGARGLLPLAGPWANFFRPYRAFRGTSGILPLSFPKNVQSPDPSAEALGYSRAPFRSGFSYKVPTGQAGW